VQAEFSSGEGDPSGYVDDLVADRGGAGPTEGPAGEHPDGSGEVVGHHRAGEPCFEN